jgi:hypothetical protein
MFILNFIFLTHFIIIIFCYLQNKIVDESYLSWRSILKYLKKSSGAYYVAE